MTDLALEAPTPVRTNILWRWAGGLALAHVVLLLAGFSQEVAVEHGDPLTDLMSAYGGADLTRVFAGGYVEAMSFVVLVPAVVLVGRLFGAGNETARVAAQTFVSLGTVLAAATLALGFAPGASALYWSQHGGDAHLVAGLNDMRNYGFVLQVAVSLAMAGALGVAALSRRIHVVWVGYAGIALGTVGIAVTPVAQNVTSLLQMIWWVGLGVLCLRGGPETP